MARHGPFYRLLWLALATVALLGALIATPIAFADDDQDDEGEWEAELSGDEEVPPVETEAEGEASFEMREDGSAILYEVEVEDIVDVFAAHIHCGAVGVNGPIGVTLFAGVPVTVDGVLARGVITGPDVGNACGWADLSEVVAALDSGDTYVNVHTLANKPGEIRGQVSAED